ncbi:MAG TPA: winged helix-turn-helix domain-containing protein [Nitrososphaera sp.]|nr:winged helix-turn-helix domain-containing protein [Nitrososphaera sp.]
MTKRNRTEIAIQILEVIYDNDGDDDAEGITQSRIMYAIHLGSAQLRQYLIALTLHGLLFYDSEMRRYHITEKGIRFLELYSRLGDILKEEEIEF